MGKDKSSNINLLMETLNFSNKQLNESEAEKFASIIKDIWKTNNPHNAMETVGVINNANIDQSNMIIFLDHTITVLEQIPDFWSQVRDNSAGHCFYKAVKDNGLTDRVPLEFIEKLESHLNATTSF